MLIRKLFKCESSHIVRNCTSARCSHSIHGHSAVIEVFFRSKDLDNAGMVYDFGLMKDSIKQFIDSMDHCYLLCGLDKSEFKDFIKKECDRWIEIPFNPSAEMLSVFVFWGIQSILNMTKMNNGESNIEVASVRYHETTTGWAECEGYDDYVHLFSKYCPNPENSIHFSEGVKTDWSEGLNEWYKKIFEGKENAEIINPHIEPQIPELVK